MIKQYHLDSDELWPVYEILDVGSKFTRPVKLDEDLVKRYRTTHAAFLKIRNELIEAMEDGE